MPNYVNPDGTKKVYGDVVYYRDGRHHFGIEVKCDVVQAKREREGGRRRCRLAHGARREGLA